MKLKFRNQQFQTDAVNAVADLFIGQEKNSTTFEIIDTESKLFKDYGTANCLEISTAEMLKNMQAIQRRNNLPLTADLQNNNFCIEMETGTGKTYVYTIMSPAATSYITALSCRI